ncbi:Protein arginine methyltransferase NDUFAF7 [Mycena indigotica]|uniref:Protein arginine methyltransferase NDUFAF7 n=1 Tax=Mycena indigotica TaxID=2126181 RepID=A0A8H6SM17_9AGAR|nr:Protein arginine methyltransferase NDUFAF7 [Mycena indigotica]KAF7301121.1 Protein arginine methyltransferase NDUFAF7 [Mycena indigotica]
MAPKPIISTPLQKIIADGIRATGPIPLATYMQLCLSHPTYGYYMSPQNSIFGTKGDFVTSPELSSVFGEIVGVWLVYQWLQREKQLPLRIVELGPGRGMLMHDILRVVAQFKSGQNALQSINLVETSPTLRDLQASRLEAATMQLGSRLEWHDSVEQIEQREDVFTLVVAHEFFDALPVHLIERTEQGWQEILVALSDANTFQYVLSPNPTAASTLLGHSSPRFATLPVGSRLEVSPTGFRTMRSIGSLIAGPPPERIAKGCGLIIDYGNAQASSNSFRAFKNHAIVDPFNEPGNCDLTANVDFAHLTEAVADIVPVHGPLPQSRFLTDMGLNMRVEALSRKCQTPEEKEALILRSTADRLVDEKGMGSQYKILGLGGKAGDVWPF